MPVTYNPGSDIADDDADILVCPLDCSGSLDRGVALALVTKWPDIRDAHTTDHRHDNVVPGRCILHPLEIASKGMRWWAALAVRHRWSEPSRMDWLRPGLEMLGREAQGVNARSIAVPVLIGGDGDPAWQDVRPWVLHHLSGFDLRIYGEKTT